MKYMTSPVQDRGSSLDLGLFAGRISTRGAIASLLLLGMLVASLPALALDMKGALTLGGKASSGR